MLPPRHSEHRSIQVFMRPTRHPARSVCTTPLPSAQRSLVPASTATRCGPHPMYPHAARSGGGSVEPVSGRANSSGIRLCAMFPPKIRLFDVSADTRPQSAPNTGSFRSFPVRLFPAVDSNRSVFRPAHSSGNEARCVALHATSRDTVCQDLLGTS